MLFGGLETGGCGFTCATLRRLDLFWRFKSRFLRTSEVAIECDSNIRLVLNMGEEWRVQVDVCTRKRKEIIEEKTTKLSILK